MEFWPGVAPAWQMISGVVKLEDGTKPCSVFKGVAQLAMLGTGDRGS